MAKNIPTRKCLGCGINKPKTDLLRIVRTPEGEYLLDSTRKKAGRGAYICSNMECYNTVCKNHSFERVFKCKLEASIYEALRQSLQQE